MSIPADSLIQQTLVFNQQGTRFSNVLHWSNASALTDANEIGNLVALQLALWIIWQPTQHDEVDFLGSTWRLPLDPMFGARATPLSGESGSFGPFPAPTTQYAIIRRTALADDANTRGRTLLAGLPDSWTERNVLTVAALIGLTPLVTALKTDIITSDSTFLPKNFSPTTSLFHTVFKTTLDPVVRSFHGRQARGGL